jgi:hypothetical protein
MEGVNSTMIYCNVKVTYIFVNVTMVPSTTIIR